MECLLRDSNITFLNQISINNYNYFNEQINSIKKEKDTIEKKLEENKRKYDEINKDTSLSFVTVDSYLTKSSRDNGCSSLATLNFSFLVDLDEYKVSENPYILMYNKLKETETFIGSTDTSS